MYLCLVHPDQALVDFGPGRNRTDVPQLVGVFSKRTCLHLWRTQDETKRNRKKEQGNTKVLGKPYYKKYQASVETFETTIE